MQQKRFKIAKDWPRAWLTTAARNKCDHRSHFTAHFCFFGLPRTGAAASVPPLSSAPKKRSSASLARSPRDLRSRVRRREPRRQEEFAPAGRPLVVVVLKMNFLEGIITGRAAVEAPANTAAGASANSRMSAPARLHQPDGDGTSDNEVDAAAEAAVLQVEADLQDAFEKMHDVVFN